MHRIKKMLGYSDEKPKPVQQAEPSPVQESETPGKFSTIDRTVPAASDLKTPDPELKQQQQAQLEMKQVEPCFSCKVVGTTTLGAGAAWSLYQTFRFSDKVHRKFKLNVLLGGFSVTGIFLTLMYYRWYDIAVFSPKREGEDLTDKIQRITNEDLDTLRAFNAKVKSIVMGGDNKSDKD